MTAPSSAFINPTGLSLFVSQNKPVNTNITNLPLMQTKCFFPNTFFKFSIVGLGNILPRMLTGTNKPVLVGRIPRFPTGRQIILTFPPNYKLRSGAGRPLRGQLWPRTR